MSEQIYRYVTTRTDHVVKLQLYAGRSSVARWFPTFAYVAIVALSWVSAWLFYVRQGEKNNLYIASAMLALLLTLSLPWLYRRYQDSFLSSLLTDDNLRGLVGPIELTINDQAIVEVGPLSTARARWLEVDRVAEEANHIAIWLAPLIVILIPHRAFETGEARHQFLGFIRSRLTAP